MLFVGLLAGGGVRDTGWCHRRFNLTEALKGHSSIKIRLLLEDMWATDWHQEVWFDNIHLYSVE